MNGLTEMERKMTLEELLQQSIELNNEKALIEQKRKELADRQLEINNLITAAKREKELEKIQLITIESIKNEIVTIDTNGTPRLDILEILRTVPSRYYDYTTQKNTININYWTEFIERVKKCPNVEIIYNEKNKELLEEYFTEKLWKVSKSDKYIVIKRAARNKDLHKMDKIPSAAWNTVVKAITVPYSEGWRVIQILPISDDVDYTPDVLELIQKQIENRQKMDEVALNKDADIPNPFVGINPETKKAYELKPFQKAGVFFAMTALGIDIPKKPEPKPW